MKKNLYEDVILKIQEDFEETQRDIENLRIKYRTLDMQLKNLNFSTMLDDDHKKALKGQIENEQKFILEKYEEIKTRPISPECEFLSRTKGMIHISNNDFCKILKGKTGYNWKYVVDQTKRLTKLVFFENDTGRWFEIIPPKTAKREFLVNSLEYLNWYDAFISIHKENGIDAYNLNLYKSVSFTLPPYYDGLLKSYFKSVEVDLQHPEKLISYYAHQPSPAERDKLENYGAAKSRKTGKDRTKK